jgi:hypothetical protein
MTINEILNLGHISSSEVPNYTRIQTEEGYYMTDWKEGQDIKEYSGSVCYYMPIIDTYADYRIITAEEHNELMKQQEEIYKAETEKNKIVNE